MKHVFVYVTFLLFSVSLYSQTYHTPDEFLNFINKTKIRYTIMSLEDKVECPEYESWNLNSFKQYFRNGKIGIDSMVINNSGIYKCNHFL